MITDDADRHQRKEHISMAVQTIKINVFAKIIYNAQIFFYLTNLNISYAQAN